MAMRQAAGKHHLDLARSTQGKHIENDVTSTSFEVVHAMLVATVGLSLEHIIDDPIVFCEYMSMDLIAFARVWTKLGYALVLKRDVLELKQY
jgi:hypothetical protein